MRLLIVEGTDEVVFLGLFDSDIAENINIKNIKSAPQKIKEDFYLGCFDGVDNMGNYFEKLNKNPDKFSKIGIIVDADSNYDSRKSSIESALKKLKYEAEKEYYILPNNSGSGMLEDLCLKISKHENLIKMIETEIFPKMKEHSDSNIRNDSKSKLMMYLSTQTPLKSKLSHALNDSKELWDTNSDKLAELKNFINKIKN